MISHEFSLLFFLFFFELHTFLIPCASVFHYFKTLFYLIIFFFSLSSSIGVFYILKMSLHRILTRSFLASILASSISLPVVIFRGNRYRQFLKSHLISQIFFKLILHVPLVAAAVLSPLP